MITREQWGARYDAGAGPAPLPAREVWLHHSVTIAPDLAPPFDDEDEAMRHLERIGEQRFHQGVSYTWAIMPSGRVYEGHGVGTLGAHTAKRNGIARAIVLVGDYSVYRPTDWQIEAAAQLLVDEWRAGHLAAPRINGGHQDAPGAATECPGRWAMQYLDAINERAAALAAAGPSPTTTTTEDDFMASLNEDEARRVLEAADNLLYVLPYIKEQADRAPDEDRQTDLLLWAVADPEQGLRVQLAGLQGVVAGMAAALNHLTSGAGFDFAAVAEVAELAATKAAREAYAELAEGLRAVAGDPAHTAVTESAR